MDFRAVRADLRIEDEFSRPAFHLLDERSRVPRLMYERLLGHGIPVTLSDIRSPATAVLGEFRITISAFNGLANAELRLGSMSVDVSNLAAADDWELAANFFVAIDSAAQELLDDQSERTTTRQITRSLHLNAEAEDFDAQTFIEGLAAGRYSIDPATVGADRIKFRYEAILSSDVEHWQSHIAIEPSLLKNASIFVYYSLKSPNMLPGLGGLDDADRRMRQVLQGIGVHLAK